MNDNNNNIKNNNKNNDDKNNIEIWSDIFKIEQDKNYQYKQVLS